MNGYCGNIRPHNPHGSCDGPPLVEGGARGPWTCLHCDEPAVDRHLCVACGRRRSA